jgi:hypothetical protein
MPRAAPSASPSAGLWSPHGSSPDTDDEHQYRLGAGHEPEKQLKAPVVDKDAGVEAIFGACM